VPKNCKTKKFDSKIILGWRIFWLPKIFYIPKNFQIQNFPSWHVNTPDVDKVASEENAYDVEKLAQEENAPDGEKAHVEKFAMEQTISDLKYGWDGHFAKKAKKIKQK